MKNSTEAPIVEIVDNTEYPICYFRFKGQAIKVVDIDAQFLKSVSDIIGLNESDIDSTTPSSCKQIILEKIEDVVYYSDSKLWLELHEDDYTYLQNLGIVDFGSPIEEHLLQVA